MQSPDNINNNNNNNNPAPADNNNNNNNTTATAAWTNPGTNNNDNPPADNTSYQSEQPAAPPAGASDPAKTGGNVPAAAGSMVAPPLQMTKQHTAIESTLSGPAKYVGGAPLPREPVLAPTPDVQHRQRVEDATAQKERKHEEALQKREEQRASGGCLAGFKGAFSVCTSSAGAKRAVMHNRSDEKAMKKAAHRHQHHFSTMFPNEHDAIRAAYKCKYTNGQLETGKGFFFVSNAAIYFAGENLDPTRERVPFKSLASLETVGKPPRINVYTVDRDVYMFSSFESMESEFEDGPPHQGAMNWLDHLWREAAHVPNPAALYCQS